MNEVGYKPKMIGGAMVGLQATAIKRQLGPLLNGWINYETWVPDQKMMFAGTEDFLKKYQARAAAEGVDPLGYYLGTWGYAYIQILGDAVAATKSLNDNTLADYLSKTTFKTIMGDVKFGQGGEWAEGRMLQVQYHGIKSTDLDAVPRHGYADRAHAAAIQDRHRDLSVREGEVSSDVSRVQRCTRDTQYRASECSYPPPWSAPIRSRIG